MPQVSRCGTVINPVAYSCRSPLPSPQSLLRAMPVRPSPRAASSCLSPLPSPHPRRHVRSTESSCSVLLPFSSPLPASSAPCQVDRVLLQRPPAFHPSPPRILGAMSGPPSPRAASSCLSPLPSPHSRRHVRSTESCCSFPTRVVGTGAIRRDVSPIYRSTPLASMTQDKQITPV